MIIRSTAFFIRIKSVGKWMTHPAFQNFDVTGLWVGKFETGNDNGIIVKPNVPSWKNATVSTFFKTSYNYKLELSLSA